MNAPPHYEGREFVQEKGMSESKRSRLNHDLVGIARFGRVLYGGVTMQEDNVHANVCLLSG
jgi:hypothetical protein